MMTSKPDDEKQENTARDMQVGSMFDETTTTGMAASLTTIAGDTTSLDSKVTACNTGAIAGTVTANAGTNLNTSALALEAGNLATLAGKDFATQTTLATLATEATVATLATEATAATLATEATAATLATEATVSTLATEATAATLGTEATLATLATEATAATLATETTVASLDTKEGTTGEAADVDGTRAGQLRYIGEATESSRALLSTIDADTSSIDGKITACDTGAVVVASGAITETNSGDIKTAVEKIDDLQGALKSVDTDELVTRITDSAGTEINPAKEDGNLATIVTNTAPGVPQYGTDATGADAYATIITTTSAKKHLYAVNMGTYPAIISLDGGVTDHLYIPENSAATFDQITIGNGVNIQAKNGTPGSNYTNLYLTTW